MERFRVEVGRTHGVEVANIVGAIASEADIRAEFIGRVDIHDEHSLVELPEGMPKFMLKELRRVWVCGRQLGITRLGAEGGPRVPSTERTGGPGAQTSGQTGGKRDRSKPRGGKAAETSSDPSSRRSRTSSAKGKGAPTKTGRATSGAAARASTHRKGGGRKGG